MRLYGLFSKGALKKGGPRGNCLICLTQYSSLPKHIFPSYYPVVDNLFLWAWSFFNDPQDSREDYSLKFLADQINA